MRVSSRVYLYIYIIFSRMMYGARYEFDMMYTRLDNHQLVIFIACNFSFHILFIRVGASVIYTTRYDFDTIHVI